jgi:hypothetical protein
VPTPRRWWVPPTRPTPAPGRGVSHAAHQAGALGLAGTRPSPTRPRTSLAPSAPAAGLPPGSARAVSRTPNARGELRPTAPPTHACHRAEAVGRQLQCVVRCPSPARDGPHRCGPPPQSRHEVSRAAKEPGRGASAGTQPRPTRARRSLASAPRRGPLTLGLHERYRAYLTPAVSCGPQRYSSAPATRACAVGRQLQCDVRCPRPAAGGSRRPGPLPRPAVKSRVRPGKPGRLGWQGPGWQRRTLAGVSRCAPRRPASCLGLHERYRAHLTPAVSCGPQRYKPPPGYHAWAVGRQLQCDVQVSRCRGSEVLSLPSTIRL